MREIDVRRHLPVHLTWMFGLLLVWISLWSVRDTRLGQDSHAYWNVWQGDWASTLYAIPPGHLDAFNYSPAFAQLIRPLATLPWPVFGVAWSLAATATFVYLLRPLGRRWALPLVLCCAPEILSGNIFWVLALVAALSARADARPSTACLWAGIALTKVTPALGPIWYAVRREWRPFAWSVAATLGVALVSLTISPDLWARWLSFLLDNEGAAADVGAPAFGPLVLRLPTALLVLVWGAATGRRWTLPVAMALATPVGGPAALTTLAAIPRLTPAREPSAVDAAHPAARARDGQHAG